MKTDLVRAVLMGVVFAGACGDDGNPTAPATTARVRFFNATTGMAGPGGFTTNGQFAAGSALALGQATSTCTTLNAGATSFGFGAANSGATGLSGSELATLTAKNLWAGGDFTVVATGSSTSPTLFLLDNTFSGSLGASQAAIRFVNLAPGAENPFNVLVGELGAGGTVIASNIAVGSPSTFSTVTSGPNAFTIFKSHEVAISGSAATVTVQGGTVNTVAIVSTASGGFQLINVPRCS